MSLDDAIAVLEIEVAGFKLGTQDQPKADTPEFFLVRAKAVGLSMLKQMRAKGLSEPERIESFYKQTSVTAKAAPESVTIEAL